MTSGELLLNLGLVAFMLHSNLGVKHVTVQRFLRPLAILSVVGYSYIAGMPTAGNDIPFVALGAGVGLGLGFLTAAATHVEVLNGRVVTRAGAAFAAIWITTVAARIAFAEGSTHVFPGAIASFSRSFDITGGDAWAAMFVLMAFGMVIGRLAVLGVQVLAKRQRVLAAA